jgi:hypothetical protein
VQVFFFCGASRGSHALRFFEPAGEIARDLLSVEDTVENPGTDGMDDVGVWVDIPYVEVRK